MKRIFYTLFICLAFASCKDQEPVLDNGHAEGGLAGEMIQIAGVETSALNISAADVSTRANTRPAEELPWLIDPLKEGLDIWYWPKNDLSKKDVAILKLVDTDDDDTDHLYDTDPDTGWAIYTFNYKSAGDDHLANDPAVWYGNGEHIFEGMYVPQELRYSPSPTSTSTLPSSPSLLTTNQSRKDENNVENYTYLERYLAMPANTQISATVGRVKLPFRHRLARVLAYVLIDPAMGEDVTLQGFSLGADGKDDPATTKISFGRVQVLSGVKDVYDAASKTHTLTPQWKEERKVVPHFWNMRTSVNQNATVVDEDNFIMYYDDNKMTYIFPTNEDWSKYHDMTTLPSHITKTEYGSVPVYDLIVRPTYTSVENVMYDEAFYGTESDMKEVINGKNKIEFELTLSNGLTYTKEFVFSLDANYETVVYLRINRESVDYNASGAELWINNLREDDWYGVDNTLGHSLSKAGSSWQRAYTYGSTVSTDKVTDGGFYNEETTPDDGVVGQYLEQDTWIEKFVQAYEKGACHGDYFILTSNIEIDAHLLPDNFVFTGHLDAMGHVITLKNTGAWTEWKEAIEYPADGVFYISKSKENTFTMPAALFQFVPADDTQAAPARYSPVENVSLAMLMSSDAETYFTRSGEGTEESPYTYSDAKPAKLYVAIDHAGTSALFAGLNGAYTADAGTANVHLENGVLVPYTDGITGWRAEVLNLTVAGGKLFPDGAVISGNVQNCSDADGTVSNRTPALSKYN